MKKLRVTVEGKIYEVLVEILDEGAPSAPSPTVAAYPSAPIAAPINAAASAPVPTRPSLTDGAGDVPSPLAGKIVTIDVKAGQSVEDGAQVATIEAMKMNTYIFAPKAGRITEVLVNPGDGVEEGTVLLRIG